MLAAEQPPADDGSSGLLLQKAPPDVDVMSSELSGMLAAVLGGLQERVATLEGALAESASGKVTTESQLAAANERLDHLEKAHEELLDANAHLMATNTQLEDGLEQSLAAMLSKMDQMKLSADEDHANMAGSVELLEGMKNELSELRSNSQKAKAEENWDKVRSDVRQEGPTRGSTSASTVMEVVLAAQRVARRQREQGNLMKDWTDMLEGRLHAVEAKLGPLENRSTDEDGIAVRAAASAIEAIRAEVAMQVRSAVQTATDGMRRESQKTSEHLKQSLATNRADQEALAATLREECNRVQGEARRATEAAAEALQMARLGRLSLEEMKHVQDRLESVSREMIKLRSSKCDVETFNLLEGRMADTTMARMAELERRLAAQTESLVNQVQDQMDARLEASIEASRLDYEGALREESRAQRMALRRKLDGVSEFAALQQIASEDGKNGARLKSIQSTLANVLDLVLRIDPNQSAAPSPVREAAAYVHGPRSDLPPAGTRQARMHARPSTHTAMLGHSPAGIIAAVPGLNEPVNSSCRPSSPLAGATGGLRRPASASSLRGGIPRTVSVPPPVPRPRLVVPMLHGIAP